MNIVVVILSALLVCLSFETGFGIESQQRPEECVEYFLKIVPVGDLSAQNLLDRNNVYFELFDVNANKVLDKNRVDSDGILIFKFCPPPSTQKMTLRYRFGDPGNRAIDLSIKTLVVERAAKTSLRNPHIIRFEPDGLLGGKDLAHGRQTQNGNVAVPVRFSHCSGRSDQNPNGILVVKDVKGKVVKMADARSNVIPLDRGKTSHLSFKGRSQDNTYRIRPQSVTPLLLKRFDEEPFEIEVTEVPKKELTLKLDGLVPGATPRIFLKDSKGFKQTLEVNPNDPLVRLTLALPCRGPAKYTLNIMEDDAYQGGVYDVDLGKDSPEDLTVVLAPRPAGLPQYYFLINIAGRQMQKGLKIARDSLKIWELKKLTGDQVHVLMAFEGTVKETDFQNLYADPSVRENLPRLLKNLVQALPRNARKHLIYVTSSSRTMRYRSDLPQKAMIDQLSDGHNMTFSAIVIGNIDSKELKEMADLGNGIYRTVPAVGRDIQGTFGEVIGKLN